MAGPRKYKCPNVIGNIQLRFSTEQDVRSIFQSNCRCVPQNTMETNNICVTGAGVNLYFKIVNENNFDGSNDNFNHQ